MQRAEKKLYLDKMVNSGASAHAQPSDDVSASEMLSMLKFGAACCFAAQGSSIY